jgi:hypothetical protein
VVNGAVPRRSMVGLGTLNPAIPVRVRGWQPEIEKNSLTTFPASI